MNYPLNRNGSRNLNYKNKTVNNQNPHQENRVKKYKSRNFASNEGNNNCTTNYRFNSKSNRNAIKKPSCSPIMNGTDDTTTELPLPIQSTNIISSITGGILSSTRKLNFLQESQLTKEELEGHLNINHHDIESTKELESSISSLNLVNNDKSTTKTTAATASVPIVDKCDKETDNLIVQNEVDDSEDFDEVKVENEQSKTSSTSSKSSPIPNGVIDNKSSSFSNNNNNNYIHYSQNLSNSVGAGVPPTLPYHPIVNNIHQPLSSASLSLSSSYPKLTPPNNLSYTFLPPAQSFFNQPFIYPTNSSMQFATAAALYNAAPNTQHPNHHPNNVPPQLHHQQQQHQQPQLIRTPPISYLIYNPPLYYPTPSTQHHSHHQLPPNHHTTYFNTQSHPQHQTPQQQIRMLTTMPTGPLQNHPQITNPSFYYQPQIQHFDHQQQPQHHHHHSTLPPR